MKTWRVEWTIEIESESAKEAAEKALKIQRDKNSIATVFRVVELDNPDRLLSPPEDIDVCRAE